MNERQLGEIPVDASDFSAEKSKRNFLTETYEKNKGKVAVFFASATVVAPVTVSAAESQREVLDALNGGDQTNTLILGIDETNGPETTIEEAEESEDVTYELLTEEETELLENASKIYIEDIGEYHPSPPIAYDIMEQEPDSQYASIENRFNGSEQLADYFGAESVRLTSGFIGSLSENEVWGIEEVEVTNGETRTVAYINYYTLIEDENWVVERVYIAELNGFEILMNSQNDAFVDQTETGLEEYFAAFEDGNLHQVQLNIVVNAPAENPAVRQSLQWVNELSSIGLQVSGYNRI